MIENLYICAIEQNTMILCERHSKAFETAATVAKTPHTIVELDDADIAEGAQCHACNLQDELTRPRIIIAGN
jgi:hypothetical protein